MSRRRPVLAVAAVGLAAVVATNLAGVAASAQEPVDQVSPLATATVPYTFDPDLDRRSVPEDRYAMASGCYAMTPLAGGSIARGEDGFVVSDVAEPFHFQATDLGQYLLYGTAADFLAAGDGPAEQTRGVVDQVNDVVPVGTDSDVVDGFDDDVQNEVSAVVGTDVDTGSVDDVVDLPSTHTGIVAATDPSASADWLVEQAGPDRFTFALPAADGQRLGVVDERLQLLPADTTGPSTEFVLRTTDGCATWPEVDVNVDGPLAAGTTPYGETVGYLDAHLHMMAYEFIGGRARCGEPWHRYGVTVALGECGSHDPGSGNVLEFALSSQPPGDAGWPTFGDYPNSSSLTYEQVYYTWMERAWRSGLRMFTNLLVENNVLCEAYPLKQNSCNEMDAVRLQAQRLRELERYVDAQSGGPGEGWFRIVTDPFQAREVVNAGRLAVVMGIEVSVLFDCGEFLGTYRCDTSQIDRQLQDVYDLGVRQMELVNKFDNALSGVTGDGGATGALVGQGNKYETGHNWYMETCPTERDFGSDRRQPNVVDDGGLPPETGAGDRDALAGILLNTVGRSGVAPVYPAGPHCNTIGLTELGAYAVEQMAAKGIIIDPDHQSARGQQGTLDVAERLGYSGLISSHSWGTEETYQRVYDLGGMVTPYAGGSAGFVSTWQRYLRDGYPDDRYTFGFGYGADTNGFGGQGGARNPAPDNAVQYPFTALGGATVDRNTAGERTWDFNTEGTAHYGLYADWIEDLRVQAGDAIIRDMARGPEAYLQVWERAVGIAKDACHFPTGDDPTAGVRRGMTPVEVLEVAGQPTSRVDDTFTYCGRRGNKDVVTTVTFDEDGRVAKVKQRKADGGEPQRRVAEVRAERAAAVADARPDPTAPEIANDHVHDEATDHEDVDRSTAATVTTTANPVVGVRTTSSSMTPTGGVQIALLVAGLLGGAVWLGRRRLLVDDGTP